MKIENTSDLRQLLIETIADIRSGKMEAKAAAAIGNLSGKIIQSARLDLEAVRLNSSMDGKLEEGIQVLQLVGVKTAKEKTAKIG